MRPRTRSCFLLPLPGRLFLFAVPHVLETCLLLLQSPPFPLHAPAPIPFFLAKIQLLPTLILSSLTIWCSALTILFHFLLVKEALAFLPTALSVTLRLLFPFRQTQYAQVLPLKPAPFCKLFAGLGSTNKSATFLLLFLTLALSSPLCLLLRLSFYLNLSNRFGRNCLLSPPVLSDYNGFPDTRFSRGTTRLMSWPDKERYSYFLPFFVVSLLLSLVSTPVFSQTGGVLSHRNFSTCWFPQFPPRNLRSLVTVALCSLVSVAANTAFC